ncbi:MAG: DUF565 domain-containing protein [Synechococcus sp. H1_metabat_bins_2.tsv.006]|nr:DUF565 domain-containing protein [Synechococcus sp. H1_metabat_bins_2.tsv.006]
MQATRLNRLSGQLLSRLSQWAENPWRRFSLLLLVLLAGFSAGVSIGSVAGVLMVIDPVGALVVVAASELAIKARRPLLKRGGDKLPLGLLDMARMGIVYGLLLEGVKSSI